MRLVKGNPCNDLQGFPTELTPRVIPCCIVRIFEECRILNGNKANSLVQKNGYSSETHYNKIFYLTPLLFITGVPGFKELRNRFLERAQKLISKICF